MSLEELASDREDEWSQIWCLIDFLFLIFFLLTELRHNNTYAIREDSSSLIDWFMGWRNDWLINLWKVYCVLKCNGPATGTQQQKWQSGTILIAINFDECGDSGKSGSLGKILLKLPNSKETSKPFW